VTAIRTSKRTMYNLLTTPPISLSQASYVLKITTEAPNGNLPIATLFEYIPCV
jgi:hypothetical protein